MSFYKQLCIGDGMKIMQWLIKQSCMSINKINKHKDKNPRQNARRINLNNYAKDEDDNAGLKEVGTPQKDVDKNLNEQLGGSDNTVRTEPNNI